MHQWKKLLAVSFTASLLTGCATMLPHYRLSDSYTQTLGHQSAIFETCSKYADWPPELSYQFSNGVTELLNTAVAKKSLYEKGYTEGMREVKSKFRSVTKKKCGEAEPHIPVALSRLNKTYQSAVEARSTGFSSISSALSDFNDSMQTFNNNMAEQTRSMSSPNYQPNFGTSQQQTNSHYIINTPQGQRQCTKTSSGYVHCY